MRVADKRDFEVGSLVTLRSGSPRMTVTGLHEYLLETSWVAYHSGIIHNAILPYECFKLVEK